MSRLSRGVPRQEGKDREAEGQKNYTFCETQFGSISVTMATTALSVGLQLNAWHSRPLAPPQFQSQPGGVLQRQFSKVQSPRCRFPALWPWCSAEGNWQCCNHNMFPGPGSILGVEIPRAVSLLDNRGRKTAAKRMLAIPNNGTGKEGTRTKWRGSRKSIRCLNI